MQLFEYLNEALIQLEGRPVSVNRRISVWPSEASAELIDQRKDKIVGKCHLAAFFRMIGVEVTNPIDPVAARRFRTGRAMELDIANQAKQAGIFVASGIRFRVPDMYLSPEIDLVVIDPYTNQFYIVENKTVWGHGAKEVIEGRNPKLEGVMQTTLYLNEIKTGARLKELVKEGWKERQEALERWKELSALPASSETEKELRTVERILQRNRIEVNFDNLEKGLDGPILAKMAYESRDTCTSGEFDIGIYQHPVDHHHYPTIDGEPIRLFTVESIYIRFQRLIGYFQRAMEWTEAELAKKKAWTEEEKNSYEYQKAFAETIRNIPQEYWPPAEYEWKYSDEKIHALFNEGLLSKTKYNEWAVVKSGRNRKPRPVPVVGAWNCAKCSYKTKCLAANDPGMSYMALDLLKAAEDE